MGAGPFSLRIGDGAGGSDDENPQPMRQRRETVEHPFGTIKARMGAPHFLMKTLPRVASEMALHVLAYDLTRVISDSINVNRQHFSQKLLFPT
jgi:hypothetical protein